MSAANYRGQQRTWNGTAWCDYCPTCRLDTVGHHELDCPNDPAHYRFALDVSGRSCRCCQKDIESEWQFCPFCGESLLTVLIVEAADREFEAGDGR